MQEKPTGDFLRKGTIEEPKEPIAYEMAEMEADRSVFTDAEWPIVEKYLHEESLEPAEAEILKRARERWFEDKYGVPYRNKSARREVIRRKYAPPEELVAAHALQARLFAVFGAEKPSEKLEGLKEEYRAKYPDQLEGVELILSIRHFLELVRLAGDPNHRFRNSKERVEAFQDLTETNFLLAHFVMSNGGDKEFLNLFWSSAEKIAASAGLAREMNLIRKGAMTQVATMRIFEKLGMHPTMSHPADDAFNKIDMWSDPEHAVQIKSTGADTPEVVPTDEIAFPGVEVKRDGEFAHYNSRLFFEKQKFRAKVAEYGKYTNNPNLKGYFIVIPNSKVDFTTGEPDKGLVEVIGRKVMDADWIGMAA
jgi:hypothetical protein